MLVLPTGAMVALDDIEMPQIYMQYADGIIGVQWAFIGDDGNLHTIFAEGDKQGI